MNKTVRVILIDEADKAYKRLNFIVGEQFKNGKENTQEMQLLKSIKQKIDFIRMNPFYGDSIKKELIPKEYNVSNLFRVELSQFWRMIYTVKGDKIEILCFILGILSHLDYDKKFNYRKN